MTKNEIQSVFQDCYDQYPANYRPLLDSNRARLIWQIEQICNRVKPGGVVLDIGAGVVPFMLVCQRLGFDTAIIDDFGDSFYDNDEVKTIHNLMRDAGVRIEEGDAGDLINGRLSDFRFDCVTSHDSMEHWHNSPKQLFHRLWENLNAEGLFWIGVPNCVNLRKRITVPFGHGKWSAMQDWYEQPVFRGHVREPDVDDLHYIAKDVGASEVEIVGKNWLGYRNSRKIVRTLIPFFDSILQFKPSLCSDINLFAKK